MRKPQTDIITSLVLAFLLMVSAMTSFAQNAPARHPHMLALTASYGPNGKAIAGDLHWRVFRERAEADGSHPLMGESREAAPTISLPEGQYIVHVAFGLASTMGSVAIGPGDVKLQLAMKAGALKIIAVLGDTPIAQKRLAISVFASQPGNAESELVLANAMPDALIILPEGNYHIVSTYLDDSSISNLPDARGIPSNSVVSADLQVQTGKLTEATLRHHAAKVTMKLVNAPGGEALANTTFAILTPGGDPIRELIGAFPAVVLAEGEYDAIARNDGKTYEGTFKVDTAINRDVEIIAK